MRFFNTAKTPDGARFWLSSTAETEKNSIEFFDSENAARCFEAIKDEFRFRAIDETGTVLKNTKRSKSFYGVHFRAGAFWRLCYADDYLRDGPKI